MQTVVVGVDGSEGADEALAFAANEAALRQVPLRVVSAWEIPALVDLGMANLGAIAEDLAQETQSIVTRAIERATAGAEGSPSCATTAQPPTSGE